MYTLISGHILLWTVRRTVISVVWIACC